MGFIKKLIKGYITKLFSTELEEALDIINNSSYIKKPNPKMQYKRVYQGKDSVNQDGLLITNGNRKLYVRTFDTASDKQVKKIGIHRDYKDNTSRKKYKLLKKKKINNQF